MFYIIIQFHSIENKKVKSEDIITTLRIKKILTFLEENYHHPFSLSDWAENISLSKEQFCRIFKKHFNTTPIEYLINYRVSKAVDLLIHSNLSITDIAFETGFESSNYFTIVFKNKMNSTPREYRNNKNCSDHYIILHNILNKTLISFIAKLIRCKLCIIFKGFTKIITTGKSTF